VAAPLIFDCDGTLVASEPLYAAVNARVLGAYGLPMSAEDIRVTYMGVPVGDMIADMEARFSLTFPDNILNQLDVEEQISLDRDLLPIKGISEALATLQGLGHKMAVATNSQHRRTVRNLATTQLTPFFGDAIAAIDMVRQGKPAPDVYLLAAQKIGASGRDCVAIEDSPVGMRAVIAAGMVGIGYAPADHGAHMWHDLQAAGAHILIADMCELPAAIETAEELRALI
jgi:HAD superfamily hydrolase (TIGR01509 family)